MQPGWLKDAWLEPELNLLYAEIRNYRQDPDPRVRRPGRVAVKGQVGITSRFGREHAAERHEGRSHSERGNEGTVVRPRVRRPGPDGR